MISKKNISTIDKVSVTGYDKLALEQLDHRKGEVMILIRRTDFMPVYEIGNLEAMLGVSFTKIQEV
ncbi:hypothetical protein [Anaerostipes hadrus]|nr:hypothetical protein [Anaerostipes hadrus]